MFRVLFVCTANICRSPMAEHLLREGLRARLGEAAEGFVIGSAGTHGHVGWPMDDTARETLLSGYGLDGTAFRARLLDAALVQEADLVLTATREHRAAAVTLHPRAASKSFTLREFDRLLSVTEPPAGEPVERAHALVAAAAAQRGLIRPDRAKDDDVTDPYRGPAAEYLECATLLHASLQRPLDLIAGL